ncbi:MAG: S-adenosylmethionine:tRNA ribosyltransferase-isomerase [Bacteroidales bacterium]|jgi:S-adenosylmethionine:tRNA ribosyltransferase-isomerase|nr:S-adenosylmethionine:tRNA ribosyltransferase-isomerase [Bacteroidales bacterium]
MPSVEQLRITDYTYDLPDERIARYPLTERDRSKLLVYRNGKISEDIFTRLTDYIAPGDMLVFNNTRVIRARIEMEKETGARIEIFCLEPHDPPDYQLSFSQQKSVVWKCLVGNLKKWKSGPLKREVSLNGQTIELQAERTGGTSRYQLIRFDWTGGIDFGTLLDAFGHTPIPPYLNRDTEEIDETRYQTVYSKHKGSVAAPTAGLHFTPEIMQRLREKEAQLEEITLHVGAGTFRPVQQDEVSEHEMHTEFFSVPIGFLRRLLDNKGVLTAVGTTSLRALESTYWLGVKLMQPAADIRRMKLEQWEAYDLPQNISLNDALSSLITAMEANGINTLYASTRIMIVPGYTFRVCQRLITNFHQPQSTLLLLVSAFTGEHWKDIYQYALEHDFRFLSYGDSSLLELSGS